MIADVTVITPSLKGREKLLAEAKQSVREQTLPVRHHVLRDHDKEGPGVILNRLLERVKTTWYAVLPDDDLFDPEHIEILLENSRGADLVFSWPRYIGPDVDWRTPYDGPWQPQRLLERLPSGLHGVYMARTQLWRELGGYTAWQEDHDFLTRVIEGGYVIVPVYQTTWSYRFWSGSASVRLTQRMERERG